MIRAMVKQLKKEGRVTCFIDLHGHSIQKNSFIFGPATHQSSNSTIYQKHSVPTARGTWPIVKLLQAEFLQISERSVGKHSGDSSSILPVTGECIGTHYRKFPRYVLSVNWSHNFPNADCWLGTVWWWRCPSNVKTKLIEVRLIRGKP